MTVDSIVAEATGALCRFDTETLEGLLERAQAMAALNPPGLCGTPETRARMRVFASVLKETRDTFRVLEKVRE